MNFHRLNLDKESNEAVINALKDALHANFAEITINEVDCPDLRAEPWNLASEGLGGNPCIADIGGPDNIHVFYIENNSISFSIPKVIDTIGTDSSFIMGPGATSSKINGCNAELMANLNTKTHQNHSKYTMVTPNGHYATADYGSTDIGVLANLLLSQGKQEKVIHIRAKKRIGSLNFVSCIRKALEAKFVDKTIGLSGVFHIEQGIRRYVSPTKDIGKIKAHVMPDFCGTDLLSDGEVDQWLKFYTMSAPLTALSVMVSNDRQKLNLRLEHSHFFSKHGDGGHYHYDVTPEEVVYEGYFQVCETLYRVAVPTYSPSRTQFKC